jgi:uncharacterized protein
VGETIDSAATPAGALGPTGGSDRKDSLDTLRGVALLGILLMNIVYMGGPWTGGGPPTSGDAFELNLITWMTTNLFFEGTMRGLFSLMFGAGIVLMTSRAEARGGGIGVADIYYRRNLWLIAFGLIHGWLLLWPGDILYTYGIGALFLFAFRNLKPRTLIILGVLVLASLVPKDIYNYVTTHAAYEEAQAAELAQQELGEDEELDEELQEALDTWKGIKGEAKPSAEDIEENIKGMRGNYFKIIGTNSGFLVWMQSMGLYKFLIFDAVGMMLIGMALLKLGIITGEKSTRYYTWMLLIGYGVGLAVNAWETKTVMEADSIVFAQLTTGFTYDVGRVSMTLGHIGFWMLVCKSGWLQWLTSRLAAVGRMALTNYIMHSVFAAFIFTGIGFSLFGELELYQLYYVVAGIWLFQLIVSPIWMKHYRFGPLEWLWRSLTYNKKQPMRREPE